VRKSLLKHPKACPPKLAIANCKMASYDDDYSGKDPFGCLGNFPYYGAIPAGVGGWVNDVLGNVGVPGLNALAGWTKEEVALFGYLGALRLLTSLSDNVWPHAPRPVCEQATTSSTATRARSTRARPTSRASSSRFRVSTPRGRCHARLDESRVDRRGPVHVAQAVGVLAAVQFLVG